MDGSNNLFVVGAGFSFNAGLPPANRFTEALLEPKTELKPGSSNDVLNTVIRRFIDDAFGNGSTVAPGDWPELEDIFTTIDLAANTGHHLGATYSASTLRTIRRALIVRFMRMLRIAYDEGASRGGAEWVLLQELLGKVDLATSAFLSLNWDTVIEAGLKAGQGVFEIDYGCGAIAADFAKSSAIQKLPVATSGRIARILKPHGSINWMYYDCCSRMFWFDPKEIDRVASRLFKPSDGGVVKALTTLAMPAAFSKARCPECRADALGTRFATFSYRKALDFPMHLATWREAERQLRCATNWIFIGYSLPAADFEFKFLLKRVQLSRPDLPRITLITSGGPTSPTAIAYRKFFGSASIGDPFLFPNGLTRSCIDHLRKVGALG